MNLKINVDLKIKIKKQKKSFLLLEALIAISLLLGVSIGFLQIQKYTLRKLTCQAHLADAHIAYHIALAEFFQGMDEKKFNNTIKAKQATFTLALSDAPKWTCEFECTQPDKIEAEAKAFKVKVRIKRLTHEEWGDFTHHFTAKSKKVSLCIKK